MEHFRVQAADLGVEPELIAVDRIFTYEKNLREICRKLKWGETVSDTTVLTNLDMIRLHVSVFEHLYSERQGG